MEAAFPNLHIFQDGGDINFSHLPVRYVNFLDFLHGALQVAYLCFLCLSIKYIYILQKVLIMYIIY